MHRLFKLHNHAVNITIKAVQTRKPTIRSFPNKHMQSLHSCHHNDNKYYTTAKVAIKPESATNRPIVALSASTTTTTSTPAAKTKDRNSSAVAWGKYKELQSHNNLQNLTHDDFIKIRADLRKQTSWATEDRILEVLNDMKKAGVAWTTAEYDDFFEAKLFQAKYTEVIDMYLEDFQNPPDTTMKLSSNAFNVVLAAYIQLQKLDEAVKLIKLAIEQYDIQPDIRNFDRTMKRCMPTNFGVMETAKQLITLHAFDNTEVMNTNLLHLVRDKRIDDVKWIYEQQKNRVLDLSTYNILITSLCDARYIREASYIYNNMRNNRIRPNIFICNSMLTIFAHTRDIEAAEEVVRETILGGYKIDEHLYNQLINVYFKGRQPYKAFKAFEELQQNPALKINDVILNTMINGLVISKEMRVAGILYKQMIRSDFKPNIITCNTMLKGYIKAKDMKAAAEIISDMFNLGMEPDVVTFTTLIDSIFKSTSPTTAMEMIAVMNELGFKPNIYTFNAVINSWIRNGKMSEAEKTLNLMRTDKFNLQPTVHTYTNLIQGYVEQLDLKKAIETFQMMVRHGIKPDRATYNFMIIGFIDGGRLHDAFNCLEHMISLNLNPTKDTWKILLDFCVAKREWNIGGKIVQKLDESGFVIKMDSLKRVYNTVKRHCT
ncbi:hypothetical protein BDF20DRAFT_878381 [Mycotypha africana]|uniref:uncharacterized protein n=1 Tax=Mycotypha africana TaxID=64632 RepID=UPI002301C0FE|nr:uncharacterized protein BDF20DRAFT_878381 [Mycotypha africana]KAI8975398.1 hypothetical protein BDF20DRAFT_878381 [Mycotypha africana]